MINFDFKDKCYSCGACINVCPKNAITFDELLIPKVNFAMCINCNQCEHVCVHLKAPQFSQSFDSKIQGYVCVNKDTEERVSSSSGGVFILLAKKVLAQGGYVCGCVYGDDFMPKHILTDKTSDVVRMMGSKYVKSDLGLCIRKMKQLLEKDKLILFSGVPCQTAAVRNCFGNLQNLIVVTIVCHGSIERDFWNSYLRIEKQYGDIENISMRDKRRGWDNYGLRINYKDGSERITYRNQDGYFLQCFTSGYFQRDRCLDCKYKGSEIDGDILLGDAWGMDKELDKVDSSNGVSCVIILSDKGKNFFNGIQSSLIAKSVNITNIIANNQRIVSPAPGIALRERFQTKCRKKPEALNEICKKYAYPSLVKRLINKVLPKRRFFPGRK